MPTVIQVVTAGPSVADVLAITALPEETQALIRRVYGDVPTQPGFYSREDLQAAYEAGWEDGQDAVEIDTCPPRMGAFAGYLKTLEQHHAERQ